MITLLETMPNHPDGSPTVKALLAEIYDARARNVSPHAPGAIWDAIYALARDENLSVDEISALTGYEISAVEDWLQQQALDPELEREFRRAAQRLTAVDLRRLLDVYHTHIKEPVDVIAEHVAAEARSQGFATTASEWVDVLRRMLAMC